MSPRNRDLIAADERVHDSAPSSLAGVLQSRARYELARRIHLGQGESDETGSSGGDKSGIVATRVEDSALQCSFAQERLWILEQLGLAGSAYNITAAVRLEGVIDVTALELAFGEVIRRHEVLRTRFVTVDGTAAQIIGPAGSFCLEQEDLSEFAPTEVVAEMERRVEAEAARHFDLTQDKLIRAVLLKLSGKDHVVLVTMHHIVSDGWSMGVLIREIGALYGAFVQGRPSPLTELSIQYVDYALWQREWLQGEILEKQASYWKNQLAGAPAVLELPTDRRRAAVQSFKGGSFSFALSTELCAELGALARREDATLFMVLLAAFQVVLSRWSGQTDIVVGTPIAGRTHRKTEELIGFFVNTLALRTDLSGGPSFRELLRRVRETALGAYAHQDLPFEKLLEVLRLQRTLSHTPVFQVFINMLGMEEEFVELPRLKMSLLPETRPASKFDLTLYIRKDGQKLAMSLVYNSDMFRAERMSELARQFCLILDKAVRDPDRKISTFSLITELASTVLPNPTAELNSGWCGAVPELFSKHAERCPEWPAIIYCNRRWTYRELEEKSNQVASYLHASGILKSDVVAIYADRSPPIVWAVLGILKAGAAFTILDPTYPTARLIACLEAVRPRGWIEIESSRSVPLELMKFIEELTSCCRLRLRGDDVLIAGDDVLIAGDNGVDGMSSNPGVSVGPDDLAVVTFTSGSTGGPKGVEGRHGPLSQFIPWQIKTFGFSPVDRFSMLSGIAHDPLQRDIFTPLCIGATICIPQADEMGVPGGIADWLRQNQVTIAHLTPALAQVLTQVRNTTREDRATFASSLRYTFLVGDALTKLDVAALRRLAPQMECVNYYGSTETQRSVGFYVVPRIMPNWQDTTSEVEQGKEILPLGRGIEGVQLLVLNGEQSLCGVGELGEIYVRSHHLARGYVEDPELTRSRFIQNPFADGDRDRLYRTGDLGRYLPDGNLEFAGRIDHQVKIRGYRIELGEVETALRSHPNVRDAVVVVREDEPGDKRLVAYVVWAEEIAPEANVLRKHLKRILPEYMVPSGFVALKIMPLTPNGKVDRKGLPAPEGRPEIAEYKPPRTPTEEVLAGLWCEVLKLDRVGVYDNFFELGGHSLVATRMMARVREAFQLELPLRVLFEGPTIAELSERFEELRRNGTVLAVPGLLVQPRPELLPLSFAQERLWILEQLGLAGSAYNITAAVRLEGVIDVTALELAFGEVIRRHEVLRTRFVTVDGTAAQIIGPAGSFCLEQEDLSEFAPTEVVAEMERRVGAEAARHFDLTQDKPIRAVLLRLSGKDHVVLVTMHHIVSDGWSMGVLIREIGALYGAFVQGRPSPLAELSIQYVDYALWQRGWLQGEILERQVSYWKNQLAGAPAVVELPTDRQRAAVQSFKGGSFSFALTTELSAELGALARREDATLFMVLLAGFQVVLSRWSGQTDIVVGTPIAGRTHRKTEELIGFFVNTLALRTDLSGGPSFRELLRRVRETALGAYAHQDLPFQKLVEELRPVRDLSRQPVFQVMLSLENVPSETLHLPAVTLSRPGWEDRTAKFDLSLYLYETLEGLQGKLEYATDLFDGATIERLASHFNMILKQVVVDPDRRLSELSLLTAAERHLILEEWNATGAAYPDNKCVHDLFAEQVRKTPEAVAVIYERQHLTYAELDQRSNRLANYLQRLGVGPDVIVGLCIERSMDMIVGLLGILKAGGAYMPLDPGYPSERLSYMLADARAAVLVTKTTLESVLPKSCMQVVRIDADWTVIAQEDAQELSSSVTPDNLAYVIYTSGSTGKPKGVMGSHRIVVNRIAAQDSFDPIGGSDVCVQKTSISFVDSAFEILGPLTSGAPLIVLSASAASDPRTLASALEHFKIARVILVPSLLRELLLLPDAGRYLARVKSITVSGEAAESELRQSLFSAAPQTRLFNLYGASEVAGDATGCELLPEQGGVPIGRPIRNLSTYVLDDSLQLLPIGVVGEIYIGGIGLARGYLGRPGLTAERFIPNPYGDGDRLYRTGDLGRYLPDGNLEFAGRIDHQVKIRGYRIELGEVETALRSHPNLRDAVVVVREDEPGDKRLVAYVVGAEEIAPEANVLRAHLKRILPEYMVPSGFVALKSMPLTPSGKVDRGGLPAPEGRPEIAEYKPPRTPTEEVLAGLWCEVLKLDRVGVYDNFFELGGHSLVATRMMARLREAFQVELPLRVLIEGPTIAELSFKLTDGHQR
ncbi:non-ribosomal peptide synthetase [Bradyrhizobium sp. SZCCHNRI2014]|uniref:non-ribosomal peptide synthetase n=1 Tax=Bradyrhizobium sp. SZCCHNRI2014 TaxID=3057285 RepID=UPI002916D263|nr:non-ribosomal peptide synthetase [Bradyrhizobium sp. SZCCHNRI2014]